MTLHRWRSEPGYLFRRMQQIAVAIFAEECEEFGLTCLQYSTLARISERPGIDVTRLSEIMEFDRSTLGGVVERLEMKGYIRRSGTTNDRRIKLLEATRQGQAILDQIEPCLGRINRRLLGCLSADEQKILSRLMTRLVMENAHIGSTAAAKVEQNKVVIPLRRSARARRSEANVPARKQRYLKSV